jgi:dienelactone hydrolase
VAASRHLRDIRETVELDADGGEPVPGILQRPASATAVPGVLLIHGFSSRKERMADSVGRALLRRGVASLAVDLPLHGARDGSIEGLSLRNPLALVQKWRQALRESNRAIHFLAEHPAIDPRRVGIGGYSLGSYIAVAVAAGNGLVRAVALAAGGDLPRETPFAALVRAVADPQRAVRRLAGRPLLMINGRHDRTIRPVQARALFAAAGEPKELRWFDGGHWPPQSVIEEVADWLADRLGERAAHSRLA